MQWGPETSVNEIPSGLPDRDNFFDLHIPLPDLPAYGKIEIVKELLFYTGLFNSASY